MLGFIAGHALLQNVAETYVTSTISSSPLWKQCVSDEPTFDDDVNGAAKMYASEQTGDTYAGADVLQKDVEAVQALLPAAGHQKLRHQGGTTSYGTAGDNTFDQYTAGAYTELPGREGDLGDHGSSRVTESSISQEAADTRTHDARVRSLLRKRDYPACVATGVI